jgi:hypothetical protein
MSGDHELIVDVKGPPGDSGAGGGTSMAPIVVPVFAAGLLAKLVSPTAGLAALGAGVLGAIALAVRKPREGRFILRVEGSALVVQRERSRTATTFPLADLLDVSLDRTKHAAGRGGAAERLRLVLERRAPEPPIFVPEDHTTPIEAQEWLANVRVFLRKNGWVPVDERSL